MAEFDDNEAHSFVRLEGDDDVSAPLRGTVICCTSIAEEKRTELADWALQMGAVHRFDLTPEVTHLIVGDQYTPKYVFVARERPDVRPMTVGWIEALRELWINYQPLDLDVLEKEHTLPTFHGLKFSMTGCDDPVERTDIADCVKQNGATYEGDLTKSITHLISFRTEGAKYKAAKNWGLRIVSIEWLRDSLERGMILDEKLYDPSLPTEERGKGAWDRAKPKTTSLGKRIRENSTATVDAGRRKLRRTASTKLNSQSQSMWGDIVGGSMQRRQSGEPILQVERSGIWETNEAGNLRQATTTKSNDNLNESNNTDSMQSHLTIEHPPMPLGMFGNCRFHLHGFPASKTEILSNHLLSHDGDVPASQDDFLDPALAHSQKRFFRIIPHDLPLSALSALPESEFVVETVTFWWVERCLHHKKFFEPNDHIVGRPFPVFPIEGFADLTIASSGFSGIDLLHLKRATELISAEYSEDMTPQTSVLIAKNLAGLRKDKYDHAQEWSVPIVTVDWLWDSIEKGEKLSRKSYRVRSQKRSLPGERLPTSTGNSPSVATARLESIQGAAGKVVSGSKNSHSDGFDTATELSKPRLAAKSKLDTTAFTTEENETTMSRHSAKSSKSSTSNKLLKSSISSSTTLRKTPLDTTAGFINPSPSPQAPPRHSPHPQDSIPTQDTQNDSHETTEPLKEINPNTNSPTRVAPVPKAQASVKLKEGKPQTDISNAISNLLSLSKSEMKTTAKPSAPEPPKRRGRILGRVTSNLSASSNHSLATSVDSTATSGNPVQYSNSDAANRVNTHLAVTAANATANERIEKLLEGDKARAKDDESQPPLTQVTYEAEASKEAKEMALAKMEGRKVKRHGKEKAITVGDFSGGQPRNLRRAGRGLR